MAIMLIISLGALVAGMFPIIVAARAASVRRQLAQQGPQCGNCGYNLTGSPSNRCPECGQLFIEAGIITEKQATAPLPQVSRTTWLVFAILIGLAFLGTIMFVWRIGAVRTLPIAPRQAAPPAKVTTQQSNTTVPAVTDEE